MADKQTQEQAKASAIQSLKAWGGKSPSSHPTQNPLPPTLLATLVTAQHMRPFQALPMLFPPVLLFTSYMNVNGYKTDAAGIAAAWSGLYMVLARRRKQAFMAKFGARGIIRGATLALCAANLVGGGVAYAFGRRKEEPAVR